LRPVRPTWRRVAGLVALAAAGVAVGVVGSGLTGSAAWFLAIPLAIAAGWLAGADPTQCAGDPPRQP